MRKETKEFLTEIAVVFAIIIAAGTAIGFFMSGIPVLQIIATVMIVAALIYGMIFSHNDNKYDDFRG